MPKGTGDLAAALRALRASEREVGELRASLETFTRQSEQAHQGARAAPADALGWVFAVGGARKTLDGWLRALAGCDEAFRALGDLNRIGERVEEAEVEALRGDLQELVRLYAITSSAAHSDLVRVGDMTTRAGETRKSFAYYEGSDEGGTCDMAG